ncbi:uncharacterized protein TNCV_3687201 [Trichonephila clavipes]|nr:uncharacterized protein TNCV_3687201 [Trichonephila clavipes]
MHSISSKYRKPKGRLIKRTAACISNLKAGKSAACNSSSDNECDEISKEAVPSTSGSMEMHDAHIFWNRSISDCAIRYTTILCDGEAKTHQHLNEKKVYGDDVAIEKEDFVNHVAKRLGTALRDKVKEWRVKGGTLGGRKQGSLCV